MPVTAGIASIALLVISFALQTPDSSFAVIAGCALLIASMVGATAVDNAALAAVEATARLAVRNTLSGILAAVLQVALGIVYPSMFSLTVALVLGRAIALILTRQRASSTRSGSGSARAALRHIGARNIAYAASTACLGAVSPQIGLFAMTLGAGGTNAGQFALAQRAAGAPATLLGGGLSQHYVMKLGKVAREGTPDAWVTTRSQLMATAPLAIFVAAALSIFGLFGFELVFGQEWALAGQLTAVLSPALGLQMALGPLAGGFVLLQQQRSLFVLEVVRSVTMVLVLASITIFATRDPMELTIAFSVVSFLGHLSFFFLLLGATKRWDRIHE